MNFQVSKDGWFGKFLIRMNLHEVHYSISPDGYRYLAMGQGVKQARPYHYRWLLPFILRDDPECWILSTRFYLLCLLPLAYWFLRLHGLGTLYSILGASLILGLVGVWRFNVKCPVLVDIPAQAFALLSANLCLLGLWIPGMMVSLVGACIKETTPVFASLWAFSPFPLVGLIAPLIRHIFFKAGEEKNPKMIDVLKRPLQTAWKARKGRWLDGTVWLQSWGILLLGLTNISWQLGLTLAASYGQCLVATDNERLYQWAWPILLVSTMDVIPAKWILLLTVLHFMNPVKIQEREVVQ